MSEAEEPFQMVKSKKFRRKHKGQTQLYKAQLEACHIHDDAIDSSSVLKKLHDCR